jgi:hypothetical protein
MKKLMNNLRRASPHRECCGRLGGQSLTHSMKIRKHPRAVLCLLIPCGRNHKPSTTLHASMLSILKGLRHHRRSCTEVDMRERLYARKVERREPTKGLLCCGLRERAQERRGSSLYRGSRGAPSWGRSQPQPASHQPRVCLGRLPTLGCLREAPWGLRHLTWAFGEAQLANP